MLFNVVNVLFNVVNVVISYELLLLDVIHMNKKWWAFGRRANGSAGKWVVWQVGRLANGMAGKWIAGKWGLANGSAPEAL
jgi:hypothetical protein